MPDAILGSGGSYSADFGIPQPLARPRPARQRTVLASILFFITLATTTTLGAVVHQASRTDATIDALPYLTPQTVARVWGDPGLLAVGLLFSLPLMFILLAHEAGHWFACRYYRVPATLPYFLPSPFFIGTFGAFIRIRGRIRNKRELFDVGIAGPLAGAVALLPFLVLGIWWSQPALILEVPLQEAQASLIVPGQSLLFKLLSAAFHGPLTLPLGLDLHPFALAAWVGMLATSLNLIPLGQLDGGHILYAVFGRRPWLRLVLWLALLACSALWSGWLLWALILLVVGRHPPLADEGSPLGPGRRRLAWVALALLVLTFMPVPIEILPVGGVEGQLAQLP